jgi:hypothetical protein
VNPGDGLWMIIMSLVLSMVWRLTFLYQVHYLLLLPTLEYVLAQVVYDDVKRIWELSLVGFSAE